MAVKIVEDPEAPQTIFDGANIDQPDLVRGLESFFGREIPEDELGDVILAELVRRYIREDRSPPGGQDQTRLFDVAQIAAELPIRISPEDLDGAMAGFDARDLVTLPRKDPDIDLEAPPGHYMLTHAGVQRGLALIDKFVPRPRYPVGALIIDSRTWTGLTRRVIDESNRDKIVSAIEKAILFVDQKVRDNERHAQAVGYLRAAIALAETPSPPSRQIWEFIHRASSITGLFALFVTIFRAIL
jgi:hypothetical protein